MKKALLLIAFALLLTACPDKDYVTNNKTVYVNKTVSEPSPVPEPTTLVLIGVGLIGLAGYARWIATGGNHNNPNKED